MHHLHRLRAALINFQRHRNFAECKCQLEAPLICVPLMVFSNCFRKKFNSTAPIMGPNVVHGTLQREIDRLQQEATVGTAEKIEELGLLKINLKRRIEALSAGQW